MQEQKESLCGFDRVFDRCRTHDLKWRQEGVEAYLNQKCVRI